jgi:hypothetical protein
MMAEPETREDRFTEITRRYSEAIRGQHVEQPPTITKPADLESYRQERMFRAKQENAWAVAAESRTDAPRQQDTAQQTLGL